MLGLNVPKPNHIRLGNWEARPLGREAREYAALDAFMGLRLHWALAGLPRRVDPKDLHMAALRARAVAAAQAAAAAGTAAAGTPAAETATGRPGG